MKAIAIGIISFIFISCSTKPAFYKGYVYYDNKPLKNVTVKKMYDDESFTKTDSTGYFILQKRPNTLRSLIFEKKGFITDTIPSVWTQHGEKVKYTFLNKYSDTIILRKKQPNNKTKPH